MAQGRRKGLTSSAPTLQPLEKVKGEIQILGGLDQVNAYAGPDGPGDHARASGTFLTGVRVKKTAGSDIHAGVSVDQVAAQRIGHLTRFPSLELTCDGVRKSGNCDSGYSCAYQYNLSWSTPTLPVAPEPNPRFVFERLFGAGPPSERKQEPRAPPPAAGLDPRFRARRRPGARATARPPRSAEARRIPDQRPRNRTPHPASRAAQGRARTPPSTPRPASPPRFQDHIQLMFDMMVLAFQTDSTRIATFLLANEGSNRTFPEIGIPEGHHNLSHHMGKREMMDKIAEIDLWYMRQFARFLDKLAAAKDVDGESLLAQFDDHLRQRQRRRQPPHPFQPAAHPCRQRRRQPFDRPLRQVQDRSR